MYVTAQGSQLKLSAATTHWMPNHTAGTVTGTAGNDIFYALAGDRMAGGAGDDRYTVWGSNFTITERASEGTDTLDSYAYGTTTLPANVENLFLHGASATGGIGNALDNIVAAGSAGACLDGGAGNDVLVGGDGRDMFEIRAGNGSDAIEGFTPGQDQLRLDGYGIASFASLMAHAVQDGADVRLTLSPTEQLVLRDMSLADLHATDVRLVDIAPTVLGHSALDPLAAGSALTQLTGAGRGYSTAGWYVLNNAWGSNGLVSGRDYQIASTFSAADLTGHTSLGWSYPTLNAAAGQTPTVLAYPEIAYGPSPFAGGHQATDIGTTFPVQVSALTALTADYDVALKGDTAGCDVAFDIWLTKVPNGNAATITNEVMVWLHQGDFDAFGQRIGTYTDGSFTGTIYYDAASHYTAIVSNTDSFSGKIDIADMLSTLQSMGIVNASEYLASIQLGAEVAGGKGSLDINKLDLAVTTQDTAGHTTSHRITGTGDSIVAAAAPVVQNATVVHGTDRYDNLTDTNGHILAGHGGNDCYTLHYADDRIVEDVNGGTDFVRTFVNYTLDANVENATYSGDGNGILTGNDLANHLCGNSGNDVLSGGKGDDELVGMAGNDTLFGGAGNDTLYGNWGDDILVGGAGADTLTGGPGKDVFRYLSADDSTAAASDLITDFGHGIDKIDLTALHTSSADSFTITTSGTTTLVSVDLGGDGTIDTVIRVAGAHALTTADVLWGDPHPASALVHDASADAATGTTTDTHALIGG